MSTKTKTAKCEFSMRHFQECLETGLAHGYRFIRFDELNTLPEGQRACILRHDVDYMPEWSVLFGEIEYKLGIKATYFYQICAETYNLRETKNFKGIHRLQELGHTLGLHFDPTWKDDVAWEDLPSLCEQDKKAFQAITGIKPCGIVSFHNPHRFVDRILNADIPNLPHSYEKRFFSAIKYLSDSQGWYEGCICKIFEAGKYERIQLCTHSYIWPPEPAGDFIHDMANMVKLKADELTQYLITYHPVCKKDEARLRQEILKTLCPPAGK